MIDLTIIIPFYRNIEMLKKQIESWRDYPTAVKVIVVDDASPEPALPLIKPLMEQGYPIRLLRILDDIPWNRNAARNLGAAQADTKWILHIDIDHIVPPDTAAQFMITEVPDDHWYRFARFRVGQADQTRMKDDIPRDCEFGEIKPHMDSYLCTRELYMSLGGYDEDFSGGLGGGTPFVKELQNALPRVDLPKPWILHVHTSDSVKDASDIFLSRDTTHYKRVAKEAKHGKPKKRMGQFDWTELTHHDGKVPSTD